jgi:ATP-dependent DNA ligase
VATWMAASTTMWCGWRASVGPAWHIRSGRLAVRCWGGRPEGVSRLPTITLMQADEVARQFHREGWVYEEKYDGWRMVAYKDGTAVRLVSRAGKDHSRRFTELAAAIRALPPETLILDGEVAIFDDKLISRFEWFRKRPEDVASTPPIYMAFDCLYFEGRDLRQLTLRERRAVR